MGHRPGLTALVACLVMVTFPAGGLLPGGRSAQEGGKVAVCTFTNPAYAGECVESEQVAAGSTAEKACRAILACLNDTRCVKSYCNATTVRRGWVLRSATEK